MLLLLVGNELDLKDHFGRTSLSLAAESGLRSLVNKLLTCGADATSVDVENRSARDWALSPPKPHRVQISRVEIQDSAQVLLGVQYEYRNLDTEASAWGPVPEDEVEDSQILVAEDLSRYTRSGDGGTSRRSARNGQYGHFARSTSTGNSRVWAGGRFVCSAVMAKGNGLSNSYRYRALASRIS
jgi:hypothetical protein